MRVVSSSNTSLMTVRYFASRSLPVLEKDPLHSRRYTEIGDGIFIEKGGGIDVDDIPEDLDFSTIPIKNNPYGTPKTLNFSHWDADGPHQEPATRGEVFYGVAGILGVSAVVFWLFSFTRGETPKSMSKEWKQAEEIRRKKRQVDAITDHKIGQPVTVYIPSIEEGKD